MNIGCSLFNLHSNLGSQIELAGNQEAACWGSLETASKRSLHHAWGLVCLHLSDVYRDLPGCLTLSTALFQGCSAPWLWGSLTIPLSQLWAQEPALALQQPQCQLSTPSSLVDASRAGTGVPAGNHEDRPLSPASRGSATSLCNRPLPKTAKMPRNASRHGPSTKPLLLPGNLGRLALGPREGAQSEWSSKPRLRALGFPHSGNHFPAADVWTRPDTELSTLLALPYSSLQTTWPNRCQESLITSEDYEAEWNDQPDILVPRSDSWASARASLPLHSSLHLTPCPSHTSQGQQTLASANRMQFWFLFQCPKSKKVMILHPDCPSLNTPSFFVNCHHNIRHKSL